MLLKIGDTFTAIEKDDLTTKSLVQLVKLGDKNREEDLGIFGSFQKFEVS